MVNVGKYTIHGCCGLYKPIDDCSHHIHYLWNWIGSLFTSVSLSHEVSWLRNTNNLEFRWFVSWYNLIKLCYSVWFRTNWKNASIWRFSKFAAITFAGLTRKFARLHKFAKIQSELFVKPDRYTSWSPQHTPHGFRQPEFCWRICSIQYLLGRWHQLGCLLCWISSFIKIHPFLQCGTRFCVTSPPGWAKSWSLWMPPKWPGGKQLG